MSAGPPRKRTKIVATLGPARDRDDTLRALIDAGLNDPARVARNRVKTS